MEIQVTILQVFKNNLNKDAKHIWSSSTIYYIVSYSFFCYIFKQHYIILLAKIYKSKNKVFNKQKSLIKTTKYAITIIGKNFVFLVLNIPICAVLIRTNLNSNKFSDADKLTNNVITR